MAINGQRLKIDNLVTKKVKTYFPEPVFSHGQRDGCFFKVFLNSENIVT